MYGALLALPEAPALPDLRVCISGGAALPVEVLHRFEERFGCQVLEGYGLSETSPVASFNRAGPGPQARLDRLRRSPASRCGSSTRPASPVRTGEVGEIAIRGHNVMKGYWHKPDETAAVLSADGWFRTGDVGKVDEDGYYFIVDRKKDLVIRGGFNIYPREIEEVLYEHPAVAEAAVIGIPHPELGEEVGAVVVLKPGATATEDELRDFVKRQVAPYKYPRVVRFVDALPKGPTGKILKREIDPARRLPSRRATMTTTTTIRRARRPGRSARRAPRRRGAGPGTPVPARHVDRQVGRRRWPASRAPSPAGSAASAPRPARIADRHLDARPGQARPPVRRRGLDRQPAAAAAGAALPGRRPHTSTSWSPMPTWTGATSKRVRFLVENLSRRCRPATSRWSTPPRPRRSIDTAGLSLVRGGTQLVKDLASAPRIPEMVDTSPASRSAATSRPRPAPWSSATRSSS